jgi:hypothetical protein
MTKQEMLDAGAQLITRFCETNGLQVPEINVVPKEQWSFPRDCAYYRPTYIKICVEKTAHIGLAHRNWSYPGYRVDRTPYGVLAHEIGHHADVTRSVKRGPYYGDYSRDLKAWSGESALTSYAPNPAEWFAEMFRLFVTNSQLLRLLRPKTYALLVKDFTPVVTDDWRVVLKDAPARTQAVLKRIAS